MEISVLIDEGVEEHPEVSWMHSVVEQVLTAQGVSADTELSLVITTQQRVQHLNQIYRGKDAPTDVLSFSMAPAAEGTGSPPFVAPPDGVLHLGEVIVSYPHAVRQAKEHRHSVRKEMAILIVHGVLHLLGFDHENAEQGRRMRARERKILSHIETD